MAEKYKTAEEVKKRYEGMISVLGEDYLIKVRDPDRDPRLGETNDGYCDSTTGLIVISDGVREAKHPEAVGDFDRYREKVLRHEIVHAFIAESGNQDAEWHTEDMVNWLAYMAPRLHAAFTAANCAGGCSGESAQELATKNLREACCAPPYKRMNV